MRKKEKKRNEMPLLVKESSIPDENDDRMTENEFDKC